MYYPYKKADSSADCDLTRECLTPSLSAVCPNILLYPKVVKVGLFLLISIDF